MLNPELIAEYVAALEVVAVDLDALWIALDDANHPEAIDYLTRAIDAVRECKATLDA